jgi:EmrB/QacA subfamily drug resistance transporter
MSEASKKRWALGLTSLGAFLVVMDSQVMTVALATIRSDLHASYEALQWTLNAYTLTFAVLLLTGAALGDRFGRRRVFVSGIALFVAASAACALAPNVPALIVARVIQGVGGALILPLTITLLSMAYPPAERGRAMGMFNAFCGLALICGPLLGGAITQGISWHAIFWINVPLGLIAIPLILRYIEESSTEGTRFDLGGLILASCGAFGLVFGMVRAGTTSWGDPVVLAALGGGCAFAIAFVAWESRAREPMIPLRLFNSRAFALGNLTSMLFNAAVYGSLFFLPQFLQTVQHVSPFGAGLRLLPWMATLFVFSPFSGALVDRIGERRLIVAGLLCQAAGTAWLAAHITTDVPYLVFIVPLVVVGAGVSLVMPATQRMIMNAVARPDVGKASGTFAMARYLGGIFGIAVLVTVFDRTGGLASPGAFTAGFVPAMWAAAAFALAGALTALAATEPRPIVTPSLSRGRHHGSPALSRTIVRINSDN